ncbi:hypothetical protein L8C07_12410 [Paenibacillus sp. CMAA1739]|uniref:hypothetical protein n=1 Tax=Paenibacillus ottowii TaxID=2315729 RepID=UPI002DBB95EC|nr:hypothetical protein [Paenibacillus sp. CMAA1739]MEC4566750.1 hypothetical protein [Paenibacillus sp. CMAA1739]
MIDMLEGHGKLSIRKLLDSCKPSNPQDMTDQQLNRWLAEYMGYTISEYKDKWGWLMCPNGDNVHESLFPLDELWGFVPDYCTDPAASLEVQAKAIEVSADKYVSNLDVIVNPDTIGDWTNDEIAKLLIATPRKRAEAAYITLSSHPLREDI